MFIELTLSFLTPLTPFMVNVVANSFSWVRSRSSLKLRVHSLSQGPKLQNMSVVSTGAWCWYYYRVFGSSGPTPWLVKEIPGRSICIPSQALAPRPWQYGSISGDVWFVCCPRSSPESSHDRSPPDTWPLDQPRESRRMKSGWSSWSDQSHVTKRKELRDNEYTCIFRFVSDRQLMSAISSPRL